MSAIEQQVKWDLIRQESVLDQSRARNIILNKAAAIETGFIRAKDLPQLLSEAGEESG